MGERAVHPDAVSRGTVPGLRSFHRVLNLRVHAQRHTIPRSRSYASLKSPGRKDSGMARSILTSTSIFRRRDYSRRGIRETIEILLLLEAAAFIRHATHTSCVFVLALCVRSIYKNGFSVFKDTSDAL